MSWTDLKRRYERGDLLASQSTEDMTARRVLRAMGLTEAAFPRAEHELGTDLKRTEETTLLERVRTYFYERYPTTSRCFRFPEVRDVRSIGDAENVLLDIAEQAKDTKGVSLVYRIKGTENVRVMSTLSPGGMIFGYELPLPCVLRATRDKGSIICDCDAQAYFDHVTGKDVQDGRTC